MIIVITFGTFDCFHIGHLNILKRARELGTYLVAGVSTDKLNIQKGKKSIYNQEDRAEIVRSCQYVDEVFFEESLELKPEYIKKYKADLLVMGDDWKGVFDTMPCKVIYLTRTADVSTTLTKSVLSQKLTINCFMYSHSYLVPILEILSKVVNIDFYFLRSMNNKHVLLLQEVFYSYCKNKFGNDMNTNTKFITFDEVQYLKDRNLGTANYKNGKSVSFGHGIDEEECIVDLAEGKVKVSYQINTSLLQFHRTIVDYEKNRHIFNQIYQIDTQKPTIIFSDCYNCPLLNNYQSEHEANVTDQILNTLIDLKHDFNVVLRFHPFQEIGFKHGAQFPDKLVKNFIVDFMPFNNFFLYQMANILVTTRYTSSGFQSLFSDLERIVFIDFDYDKRNFKGTPGYLSKITNEKLEHWLESGQLVSDRQINTIGESEIAQKLKDLILSDRFHYDRSAIANLVRVRYGLDYDGLKVGLTDTGEQFSLVDYVEQTLKKK